MATAVNVKGLKKVYGDLVAVDDVSFRVDRGEIFGLLGPNGSGKTTCIECVQGLRRPDGGEIEVLGLDPVHDVRQVRRRIGTQLQESALPDRIKVWEALQLFSAVGAHASDWAALLTQWGLAAKRNARFSSLSGGQRQRLFVALALVNDPEIVFLDEMTTGLDPEARRLAWNLIEAVREQGKTVVLVTHFLDEAERLCDRVAVIVDGAIAATGTPSSLVASRVGDVRMEFVADASCEHLLAGLPHVSRIERHGDRVVLLGSSPVVAHVGHALVQCGSVPDDIRVSQATLEDAYLDVVRDSGSGADP